MNRIRGISQDQWCLLLLVGLPFVVFWQVAIGSKVWAAGDCSAYQLPFHALCADEWRNGVLPQWNPYLDGGTPLAAAQQASAFYPFNILLWFILPAWLSMAYSVLIHLALTGIGTYLFLRSLRLHPPSALLGALTFAFSAFTVSHLGNGILRALPWIGFALYAFNSWIESRKTRYLFGISISVLLLSLSGFPQTIAYALLLIGTYFFFARDVEALAILFSFVALVFGVFMSALQLWPGLEMVISREYLRPGEGMFTYFTALSFHPAHVITLIFARARLATGAEMEGYVGVVPLVLAILGIVTRGEGQEERVRRFFIVWAFLSLFLSFGGYVKPLAQLTYRIPVYKEMSVLSKHLMEVDFCLAVLAAFGLEDLIRRHWTKRVGPIRVSIFLVLTTIIVWLGIVTPISGDASPMKWSPAIQIIFEPLLFVIVGVVIMFLIGFFNKRGSFFSVYALIALTTIDLVNFSIPITYYGMKSPHFYRAEPTVATFMKHEEGKSNPFRIISFEAPGTELEPALAKELLAADYNMTYKFESLIGHDGLQLRRFNAVFRGRIPPWGNVSIDGVDDPAFRHLLDLYGVKYLLVKNPQASRLSKWYLRIAGTDQVTLFENVHAMPRLFLEDGMRPNETLDPRNRVMLTGYEGARIRTEVDILQSCLLVHGTNYVSGWEARIDGVEVPLLKVENAVQGIRVPEGKHVIEFIYQPKSLRLGITCSLVFLCLTVGLCALAHRRNRGGWEHLFGGSTLPQRKPQ